MTPGDMGQGVAMQIQSRGFGARSTFGIRGMRMIVDGIPSSAADGQGQAAAFPLPAENILFDGAAIHTGAAHDEQAVCAWHLGRHTEAFGIFRRLLAGDHPGPEDRRRIAANRDFSVPAMLDAAVDFPVAIVAGMRPRPDADITVSVVCGPDLPAAEATLNSLLNCCTDRSRVRRWLVDDSLLN